MRAAERLLILVHPDSLCGSADFNIGHDEAKLARRFVAEDLLAHVGHVLVLHGGSDHELSNYPGLDHAIAECRTRARLADHLSRTIDANAETLHETVPQALAKVMGMIGPHVEVVVTGAWSDVDGGCVTFVDQTARTIGFRSVKTLSSAPNCEENQAPAFVERMRKADPSPRP